MKIEEEEGSQPNLRIDDQVSGESQERIDIYLDQTLGSGNKIPIQALRSLVDLGRRNPKVSWTLAKYEIGVPFSWMSRRVA